MEKLQQLALEQIMQKQAELSKLISEHGTNTLTFIHCRDSKTADELSEMASALVANHSLIGSTNREIGQWLSALKTDLEK